MAAQTTPHLDRWLALPWDAIAVHYAEIALKGGNRDWFISTLRKNLARALGDLAEKITSPHGYLVVRPAPGRLAEALAAASQVMGVAFVTPVRRVASDEN